MIAAVEKSEPVFFLESTYDEAYDLLLEARNYIENEIPRIRKNGSQAYRLVVNVETMRLSTRVTQAMAWLLTQKAIFQEGLTRDQAAKHLYRIGAQKICLDTENTDFDCLPKRLQRLLERSLALYRRIDQLDRQLSVPVRPASETRLDRAYRAELTSV